MKVLIVNNMAPFTWGGAEELAVNLQKNIALAGHEAEVLRIPFQWEPAARIPSQMLMVRALELTNVDRVIALKFPAYLIRHPHKTLWLLHQYRQAYDLFDAGQSNLPPGPEGDHLRMVIRNADNESFRESRKIFTNSDVTRDRLQRYNGFNAEILLPPINDPELFGGGAVGDYVFAGGRINGMKRQHLLIEAMAFAPKHVKLLIAGPPDTPADGDRLRKLVEQSGMADRIKLDIRFLPRDVYAGYLNNAAAVAYLPFDEDSLGYVSMEAAMASKALITTSDSGGILTLVQHNETGWVAEPEAVALAAVLGAACENKQRAATRGEASRALWLGLGINWTQTVEKLLQ